MGAPKGKANGSFRHGKANTPEYSAFKAARCRCTNPKDAAFADYGGRGIEFRFASLHDFLAVVGHRPSPQHMLDRENNEGHYEVGNVRWSIPPVSAVNRRTRKSSGYRGVRLQQTGHDSWKWRAEISFNKQRQHLGYFDSAVDAAHAYDTAALQLHGSHAMPNFPKGEQQECHHA
jgi:hypothetical protein